MKQLLIMAVSLLSIIATVVAGNPKKEINTTITMVIAAKAAFEKIIINGDMDVVLTEGSLVQVELKGAPQSIETVKHFVKKGTLYITGKSNLGIEKPVVYISVNALKYIEINGKSTISSKGVLNSKQLRLRINDEARINVRNYGAILLEADEEIDLHYEKWTKEPEQVAAIKPTDRYFTEADMQMDTQFLQSVVSNYAAK